MWLLVYRCTDDEEEACGLLESKEEGDKYLQVDAPRPPGFEHRPGYYFLEEHDGPYYSSSNQDS